MLRMEKINKNNDIVSCVLFPEDSNDGCAFEYNTKTKETKCELPKGYEYCTMHITMARTYIQKNIDNLPDRKTMMWY